MFSERQAFCSGAVVSAMLLAAAGTFANEAACAGCTDAATFCVSACEATLLGLNTYSSHSKDEARSSVIARSIRFLALMPIGAHEDPSGHA